MLISLVSENFTCAYLFQIALEINWFSVVCIFFLFSFMQWDINNEMLHGSFFADREGVAIRDWMYQAAAQADPDVDLFINDFDIVENGQLTQVNIYTNIRGRRRVDLSQVDLRFILSLIVTQNQHAREVLLEGTLESLDKE